VALDVSFAALERRTPPLAALAVAVVAVSTSAILVRWSTAPSSVKALYRVVFTVGLLLPWALTRYRDDFRRLRPVDALVSGVTGVALAVHFAAWFESLAWTSVAASVTLVQSQPLFVALGAWALLDERITRRRVVGILVAVVGMVGMSFGDFLSGVALAGQRPLYGNALAVLGAVAAAGYVLAGRSVRQRVSLVPYVTVVYVACAATLFALVVWEGHTLVDYPPREWLLFAAMAVGPGLFGHTVINWVLAHVDSSVVSVSLLGEPVGSTLLALVLLPGEVPSLPTVVGASVVLAGIAVTTTGAPAVDGDDETALENEDAAGTESSDTDGTADDPDEERTATTDD
jgi:drug/metabolite transporter (DMT)-like permease